MERTHLEAKTIAQAAAFVEEAFQLTGRLEAEEPYSKEFQSQRAMILADLGIFAGRRLIDAGQFAKALAHFQRALAFSPISVIRVWYKVVQAAAGALGLGGAFLTYRRLRRALSHRGRRLVVDQEGVRWA